MAGCTIVVFLCGLYIVLNSFWHSASFTVLPSAQFVRYSSVSINRSFLNTLHCKTINNKNREPNFASSFSEH